MAKKIKELEDEISQLISEKDKYLNIAQRAQADLVNFRKKSSQDLIESEERSYRKIFHQLILVLDQFTIAMSAKVNTKTYKSWKEGIGSINRNFISMLSSFDMTEIHYESGDIFDPNIHEAISRVDSENQNNILKLLKN